MKLDHVVYFTEKAPTEIVAEQQASGQPCCSRWSP